MELFSALVLMCSIATGQAECEAVLLPEMHKDPKNCLRQINTYEKNNGHSLSLEEKYVMSGVCVDWRFQAHKIDNSDYRTARESLNLISVTLAARLYPGLSSNFSK
jgi:hypothetical protein